MVNLDPAHLAKLPQSYLEEDIGHRLIVVAAVFIVLQTIFVTLYYAARRLNKTLNGLECWLLVPVAFVFSTGVCICAICIVEYGGAGRHVEAVLIEDPTGSIVMTRHKIDKAVEYIDYVAITASKLVILCLYMRIFNTNRKYRYATYFVGTIIVLHYVAAFILSCAICTPFAYQWDHSIPGGKCGNIIKAYQDIGIPNIVTDVFILVLPIPALYKLHVDAGTKIGLFATFIVGSAGIITCVLRLVTFIHAEELFADPTYKCIDTFIYTIAECGTYFICSCMPTLRPLKKHFFGEYSFSRSLGSFVRSKFGVNSKPGSSFGFGSAKGGIHMDHLRKSGSQEATDKDSTLHLNNAGFLKLDGNSVHSTTLSHEGA